VGITARIPVGITARIPVGIAARIPVGIEAHFLQAICLHSLEIGTMVLEIVVRLFTPVKIMRLASNTVLKMVLSA
jgi:hypothetical protein